MVWTHSHIIALMMVTDGPEMSVILNQLTWLIAQEDSINTDSHLFKFSKGKLLKLQLFMLHMQNDNNSKRNKRPQNTLILYMPNVLQIC